MGLSLRKNFGFALVGNLSYAASQYAILLIFIKLYSMEDVGKFVYAGAFTTPLMMALEMQLRNFYITDNGDKLSFKDYISFRTLSSIIGGIVLILAAWFLQPAYLAVIIIVTLIKTFESQLDLIYAVYQKEHKLDYVAYSRIIRGIVAVIVVALVSILLKNILISLSAYLACWVLLYFFYERKQVVKRNFIDFDSLRLHGLSKEKIKYFIILCAPVFCAIFIDKYYLNYPRLSVERFLGIEAVAVFGSLLYFKSLGGQFISSAAQAAMPKLADYIKENKKKAFTKLVLMMIGIGLLIGLVLVLGAWFFGKEILILLYTEEYANYNDVLVIVLLGTMVTFGYTFITSAFTAIRKQWIRLPVSILMLGVLITFFYLKNINTLMDVAYIVLYSELINLVVFYLLFIVFIKRFFKRQEKLQINL